MDKRCEVLLRFTHGGPAVLSATDSDLYVAIDRASSRTKQTLLERLGRARSRRRARRLQYTP